MNARATTCVVHRGEQAADIGLLCQGHFTDLSSILRDIEDEAILLDIRPSMALRIGTGGSGLASETSSVRLAAVAFRDRRTRRWEPDTQPRYTAPPAKRHGPWCLLCDHDTCTAWRAGRRRDLHDDEHDAGSAALSSVLGELHNWARHIREERHLTPPPRITVTGERDLLTRHLEWLAGQPVIDEVYSDLRRLLGQLRNVNQTRPDGPEGTCQLPTDDGVCGGRIWRRERERFVWRAKRDRCTRELVAAADGPATCERCAAEWDGVELDRLHLILEQARQEKQRPRTEDGRPMLTAQEMAEQLGTTINNVRVRAHRRGAAGNGGWYDPALFEAVPA